MMGTRGSRTPGKPGRLVQQQGLPGPAAEPEAWARASGLGPCGVPGAGTSGKGWAGKELV